MRATLSLSVAGCQNLSHEAGHTPWNNLSYALEAGYTPWDNLSYALEAGHAHAYTQNQQIFYLNGSLPDTGTKSIRLRIALPSTRNHLEEPQSWNQDSAELLTNIVGVIQRCPMHFCRINFRQERVIVLFENLKLDTQFFVCTV